MTLLRMFHVKHFKKESVNGDKVINSLWNISLMILGWADFELYVILF